MKEPLCQDSLPCSEMVTSGLEFLILSNRGNFRESLQKEAGFVISPQMRSQKYRTLVLSTVSKGARAKLECALRNRTTWAALCLEMGQKMGCPGVPG